MSKAETPDASWSLERLAAHVAQHGKRSTVDAWHVGAACLIAKGKHPKEFVAWLRASCVIPQSTAYRYMRLAERPLADVENLTLWEATRPAKAVSSGKTPARYVGEVASITTLLDTGSWRSWSQADRDKFTASVGKLYDLLGTVIEPKLPDTIITGNVGGVPLRMGQFQPVG